MAIRPPVTLRVAVSAAADVEPVAVIVLEAPVVEVVTPVGTLNVTLNVPSVPDVVVASEVAPNATVIVSEAFHPVPLAVTVEPLVDVLGVRVSTCGVAVKFATADSEPIVTFTCFTPVVVEGMVKLFLKLVVLTTSAATNVYGEIETPTKATVIVATLPVAIGAVKLVPVTMVVDPTSPEELLRLMLGA